MKPLSLVLSLCISLSLSAFELEPAPTQTDLQIGFGTSEISLPEGAPIGGYGNNTRRRNPFSEGFTSLANFFQPAKGKLDPILVNAFYLKNPEQQYLFLSVDTVAVNSTTKTRVLESLKKFHLKPSEVSLSATHTHSGPGATTQNKLFELMLVDLYQSGIEKALIEACERAVKRASESFQLGSVYLTSFNLDGVQENRRKKGDPIDPSVTLLLAKAQAGEWLGAVVNMGIHGTALASNNYAWSADVTGGISRALQSKLDRENPHRAKTSIIFLNGIEGDVAPKGEGWTGIQVIANKFLEQTEKKAPIAKLLPPRWKTRSLKVALPGPRFNAGACMGENGIFKTVMSWLPAPLGFFLPKETELTQIQWGNLKIASWPGEPTSSIGLSLKKSLTKSSKESVMVLGLTDDYLGYFTSPTEYQSGCFEACFSYYGEKGGGALLKGHSKLSELF